MNTYLLGFNIAYDTHVILIPTCESFYSTQIKTRPRIQRFFFCWDLLTSPNLVLVAQLVSRGPLLGGATCTVVGGAY